MDYLCNQCGEIREEKMMNKGSGRKDKTLCKSCHNLNTRARGQANKLHWVEYKGGKCELCGYNKYIGALEFHHVDPKIKDPTFQSFRYWGEERVLREIANCMLLCANCHREIHGGIV